MKKKKTPNKVTLKYTIKGNLTLHREDFETEEDWIKARDYWNSAKVDKNTLWEIIQDYCDGDIESIGKLTQVKVV